MTPSKTPPATSTLRIDLDPVTGVATLTFDDPTGPVNTMSEAWRADLAAAVDHLAGLGAALRGVILLSAKDSFFAGADLKALLDAWPPDPAAVFERVEAVKRCFRRLETLGCPVVAGLAGSALGGGFELALAAHHRIAVDDPRIQLGLPEVTLGLLPAAGGVTKLVRLLGLQAAVPPLVEGRLMAPSQAHAAGLVSELVPHAGALRDAALAWIAAHPTAVQPWDTRGHAIPGGTPSSPMLAPWLSAAPAVVASRTRGLYPAPEAVLACMVEGAQVGFDTALRLESRALAKLTTGVVARNLIHLFFDRTAVKGGAARPPGVPRWQARRIGVLGAGMMGAGIAGVVARRGIDCVLKDVTPDRADAGLATVRALIDKRVQAGTLSAAGQAAWLARIHPTADAADLQGCDLIIEAVFEQRELKAQVTREAEPFLTADGLFASNTSTLPIDGLADAAAAPDRFIGMHFFSPVDRMELVEVIAGPRTSATTLARACDIVRQLGKLPIVVRDARGFFTSRTFGTYIDEGACMLAEGIPAPVVEQAGLAAGMPVGPLAVTDEVSLATVAGILAQNRADGAREGRPVDGGEGDRLIELLCHEFGRRGRVHGGGYYDYPADGPKRLWPGLDRFVRPGPHPALPELAERLLVRQALEALRCVHEGVVMHERDANVGSVLGIGFPAYTGGAMQYVDAMGRATFVQRCRELAARHGPRFEPPDLGA